MFHEVLQKTGFL